MRRQIGPIGTAARVAVGVIAAVLPAALEGVNWWDTAGLVASPLVATLIARSVLGGFERLAPRALLNAVCSPATCAMVGLLYGAAVAFGIATPAHTDVVFWGFIGMSMVVAAARGDGGCEVLAFPNAITGRRERVGCLLFGPLDTVEARRRKVTVASDR